MGFSWRAKPRSVIKAVLWYKDFAKLEGKNWNERKVNNKITFYPIRREYLYNIHKDDDEDLKDVSFNEFVNEGKLISKSDKESSARNDKTTYEFFGFGYVDEYGIIHNTDVGNKIVNGRMDSELFLCQLLKLHFPNPLREDKQFDYNDSIYPMEILIKALNKYEYLSYGELSLIFGCVKKSLINTTLLAIDEFRKKYKLIENKKNNKDIRNLCASIYKKYYHRDIIKAETGEYLDAFARSLTYTGLFKFSGVGLNTKIRVAEQAELKIELLLKKFKFTHPCYQNLEEYMNWFGDSNSVVLPWDNIDTREKIINSRICKLQLQKNYYRDSTKELIISKIAKVKEELNDNNKSSLKYIEKELIDFQTFLNEKNYIDVLSKTEEAKEEILNKFEDIKNGNEDMNALWLEVNTWKSLIAINGKQTVKRNFNIEEDLTPKSFAPGIGNTPDMEMYFEDYIIIPEVSLMTGVKQWEHEGSSVINHVQSFIEKNKEKKVLGLFISSSINIRTKWQFYILNKESWLGTPVSVIPLTINQYLTLLKIIYSKSLNITNFIDVIEKMHFMAINSNNYSEWLNDINQYLENVSNDASLIL